LATAAFTWALRLFVLITFAFYLLRDDYKIAGWFRENFEAYPAAITFFEAIDDDLDTIYTGNLLTVAATGLIAVVTFYALDLLAPGPVGIAYPVLLGLVTGVATFIPAVGMKLVYVPYAGYLLWQSLVRGATPLWFPVVFVLVTLVVVDAVPDFFIRSYLSKGELNMGLLVLTYVLGAVAFGWYGIFFGPVVLVFFVTFVRVILPKLLASTPAGG
jgi:predicted PurR-regulated permease PerM